MPIWPFKNRETLVESLEWNTDIVLSKTSEQRFALRKAPRRTFNFVHTLSNFEYTAARALVTQQSSFQVPDWPLAFDIGDIAPSSDPQINFTLDDLNLSTGDNVLIWESNSKNEACQIISIDSNGALLDSISNSYQSAKLVPLLNAEAPNGLIASRPAGNFISCQFQPIVIETDDIGQSAYPSYRGHDLIDDCPVVASEQFNEPLSWNYSTIDNGTSAPSYLLNRDVIDSFFAMRWHVFTRSDLFALRKFIYSRRGRWKSFWLSSFGRDFELAQNIGASDTTVRVFAPNGTTDLGETTFDIEIEGATSYYRQVTSYATGSQVNGRDTIVFTIDSQLGQAITTGNIKRISYLRHLRFDADRLDFQHAANGGTVLNVACKRVPV